MTIGDGKGIKIMLSRRNLFGVLGILGLSSILPKSSKASSNQRIFWATKKLELEEPNNISIFKRDFSGQEGKFITCLNPYVDCMGDGYKYMIPIYKYNDLDADVKAMKEAEPNGHMFIYLDKKNQLCSIVSFANNNNKTRAWLTSSLPIESEDANNN